MPGLVLIDALKLLAGPVFFGENKYLPTKEKADPAKEAWAKKYFKDRDKADMGAVPELIPPWFHPREPGYKPHQKSCDEIGKNFKEFTEKMLDAVKFSHDLWKLQAKFKDLKVNAVTAAGTPGCLDGPELESNIKNSPQASTMTGNMAKHRDAVAKGVSKCFKDWQDQVTVPGLPWYPAFAAFPGPMAPPMPNIPMPLIMCPSSKMSSIIAPDDMTKAMDDALDSSMKDKDPDKQYNALHKTIASILSLAFLAWLPMQQVMLVLGKGPIPTFAPPFVPVGPVVMGDNLAIPGHLMA